MDDTKVHLVREVADLEEFLRWLSGRRGWVSCDLETSGLDWWRGEPRLAQIADRDTAWCLEWKWWAGAVREALGRYRGPLAFHNAKFDLHWLDRAGAYAPWWPQIHDTQVMVSLIDGGRPSGLKPAAARHVDPRAGRGERQLKDAMAKNGWGWDTVPTGFAPYWGYGGLDAILTARMAETLYPQIEARFRELYELERGCLAVIYGMETRGVRLDMEYVHSKFKELGREVEQLGAWGRTHHGIGMGSPAQLVDRLLQLGASLTKKTDTGKLSTDSVVLKLLSLSSDPVIAELADKALRRRKKSKTKSAYFRNFIDLVDGDRLHPSIRVMGARTGRQSVATPSLQNLTRGSEVRDAFVPSEGNRLVLADYDGIEMRILYHYCRDPALRAAIMSEDIHTTTARLAYADNTITRDDRRRQTAKSSGYAKIYGAGIETFAATAGVPVEEARDFMNRYSEAFPGVDPFMGRVTAIGRQRLQQDGEAWVSTWLGRRQVSEPDKIYKLVNYLIQGTAADVLKRQTVALSEAGLEEFMVLPVHDELVFDVPDAEVDAAGRVIDEVMPIPEEVFGVPLTVGAAAVDRWGDKYREDVEDLIDPKDTEDG